MRVKESHMVPFVREFLDSHKRLQSLLPKSSTMSFPDFLTLPYRVDITIFNDGVIVNFRRRIKGGQSKIHVRNTRTGMKNRYPMIFRDDNFVVAAKGNSVRNMTIATKEVFTHYRLEGGTIMKIPNHFGLVEIRNDNDIRFENVNFYWIEDGQLKQLKFNRFWIFGSNDFSIFTIQKARTQAKNEFIPYLVSNNVKEILKDRDTEGKVTIDLTLEIDKVKQDYLSLLSRMNLDEAEVQDFLEKHLFVLNPLYLDYLRKTVRITPQDQIGKRIVDFLMVRSLDFQSMDEHIDLVEIKKPNVSPVSSIGISHPLRVAISQLVTSLEWLEKNPQELGIRRTDNIYGTAIIGRSRHLKQYFENEESPEVIRIRRNSFIDELESIMGRWKTRIKLLTFDNLLANIEFVRRIIPKEIRYPVVVVGQTGREEDFTGSDSETIQKAINHLSTILNQRKQE